MKLYVVSPGGDRDYAEAARAAGAVALLDPAASAVDGHPVATGSTGSETLRLVEVLVAQGKAPLARGGLDTPMMRACLEAGAVGLVLEASLWLLPESPLTGRDREAMKGLTLADFAQGDVVLPSGLRVGRDALLAPFVARRHHSLSAAMRSLFESVGDGEDDSAEGGLTPASLPEPPMREAANATVEGPLEAPDRPEPTNETAEAAAPQSVSSGSNGHGVEDVLELMLQLIADQTGYPRDVLDPALDMEADLGIDTVKQAELLGAVRERYQLPRDEGIKLKDYATIEKVARYIASRLNPRSEDDIHELTSRGEPRARPASQRAPDMRSSPSAASSGGSTPAFETEPLEDAVAIIGVGAVLPKANDASSFWENVLRGVDAIVEVPRGRWDPAIHYDPDPATEDKTYSKIGGFVTEFAFDPVRFRIPPSTAKALDPVQQMALAAAAEALADAGYDRKPFDRTRCAVILGNSLGGERKDETSKRLHLAEFVAALHQSAASEEERDLVERVAAEVRSSIPPITEDTMPGELSNVIAGRLANALNLGGKNLTTDAACASSHAALDTAVKAILAGEADMVLSGGADRSMDASTFVKFCKMGALSANGSTPFDARADGFVMGEGAAILVLKRLSDAIRDEDRIYAVVRGLGASSDGKGKGITAPNPEGQKLAVRRAYQSAGIEPRHVQLLEAHGTSTKVGDVVEIEAAAELFGDLPPGSVALGSVKSQIGHLKSAAGAAGLLKAALALHHKVLPPSINFRTPNPNVDWAGVPFVVNTEARPWPEPSTGEPRRAAVSAFGFGGTNFHVILEEFLPAYHARRSAPEQGLARHGVEAPAPRRGLARAIGVARKQGELVVVGAGSPSELARAAREAAGAIRDATTLDEGARRARTMDPHLLPYRLALGGAEREALAAGLEAASTLVADATARQALSLKVKGAAYGEGPRHAGKVAFLFPGQGSQYANMCSELAACFPIVHETFSEADQVLEPLLGATLSSLLFVDPADPEAVARSEDHLKQTEVTQPAMLAADVAMFRLLAEHGIEPDMVAGHSLGEYAALVVAGVLAFPDALLAVSARGREMANVRIDDKGLMAGFACGPAEAEDILGHVVGYVVAANKNCPVQTVVAGETEAVRRAMDLATARGVETMLLPVSAAFHTSIVGPASEPLRRVLDRLDIRPPRIPVYANIDAEPYPDDPDQIRDRLARQVAAPVEWVAEMDALYEAGCRIFVEVGPKRALTGFVEATLGNRPEVASLHTNHPKLGDLSSFYEALARFAAMGFDLALPTEQDHRAIPAAWQAPAGSPRVALRPPTDLQASGDGYEAFRDAVMPSIEGALQASYTRFANERKGLQDALGAFDRYGLVPADVVVSGAAMGLPGESHPVFHDDNAHRLFAGENRIDRLGPRWAERFLDKGIVRLVKGDGEPRMEPVSDPSEVLKLAGRRGELDVERDYGVPAKLVSTLDITSKLAIAAAYEALRDAGIPMVRETIATKAGGILPGDWALPPQMQDETGVVFASAFPGYDNFAREISQHLARRLVGRTLSELDALYHELLDAVPPKKRGRVSQFYAQHAGELHHLAGDEAGLEAFNRHFLFSILSMGHAELAEAIHARGPNTQVNAACSSSTQALAVAEDWIRTSRCRRVIVVGADDVTGEHMLEWIGSGFLASGAATTAGTVEEGALPFDRRRHGMIIGMGALGMVVERRQDVEGRGMVPVARLVATRVGNGAFHGSRLHVDHIVKETTELVRAAAERLGTSVEALADETVFVSHETYTPARGGSAGAEAAALRAAFGAGATQVLVANTKGFTGHSMGAGIEDALAVKSLQYGKVPPIANLRDVDPEFADLNLSRGGAHRRRYALRFSAGFGSQIAMAFFEKMAEGDRRVIDPTRYQQFLDRAAGAADARAERVGRVLRVAARPTPLPEPAPETTPDQETRPPEVSERVTVSGPSPESGIAPAEGSEGATAGGDGFSAAVGVLERVVALVADKTGYPPEVLDPALDLEGDLGIDTVKQAEIFAQLRDDFLLPREEGLSLKDYPTLAKVAEYMASRLTTLPRESGSAVKDGPAEDAPSKSGPPTTAARYGLGKPGHGDVLPSSITVALRRRVPRIAAAPADGRVERPAFVVGHGDLADALRSALPGSEEGHAAVFVGTARELFAFARANADRLESGELGLMAVTHLGGTHGIDRSCGAEDGGVTGMAKALSAEFPRAFVRALDLDPGDDLAVRIAHVQEELRVEGSAVEVGRSKRGRIVVQTVEAGRTGSERPSLPPGCVILSTGGARGITAEVLEALADQHPTMVLVGRTPVPADDEADLDDRKLAALKGRAKEDLVARGEQATPVAIQRTVAPFRARAEVARTLRRVRAAGASAEYHSVDVSDAEALDRLMKDVRSRHGRIDGVLHAAGVEESKRLAEKDEDAFDRAWKPKAEAAMALARLTRGDDLRFFVMFGSVAGRYGNAAQTDYSAANDACAKLARVLRGRGVPASVFAWGPWGETGMATRGSALTVLGAAGVEPISTREGVEAFLSELSHLDEPEVVLAKSLGGLEDDPHPSSGHQFTRTLCADDPDMDHHRVDGVPYLAGAVGLHLLSKAAGGATSFEDVRFVYPVKLLRDQPTEITVAVDDSGRGVITTVTRGPASKPKVHFQARLSTPDGPPGRPRAFEGAAWSFDRIYPPFFHGPAYRVLDRATRVSADGVEVEGAHPAVGIPPMASTIEGAFQALGLWGLAVAGIMALPEKVSRIAMWGSFEPGATRYRVFAARLAGGRVIGDVECVLRERVVASLGGLSLIGTGAASTMDPPEVWRAEEIELGNGSLVRVRVEETRQLLERPELLSRWLSEREREAVRRFPVAKRREEWVAATLAAKSALRRAGDGHKWTAMEIIRGDDGAPLPHGSRGLTLSHAGGVAVARVFDVSRERAGVDVEPVRARTVSFEEEAFTIEERASFPEGDGRPAAVTMAWCAKEATLKALGLGLSVDLHSVVTRPTGDGISVEAAGEAKERFVKLDGAGLAVVTRLEGESMAVASATLLQRH